MIVAAMLLVIGVVGALTAFSSATQVSTAANRIQTAAVLGQRKLAEIELQSDSLSGGDQQGDFGAPFTGYHWQQTVEATDFQDLYKVTVTISWSNGSRPANRVFITYLRNTQNSQTGQSSSSTSPTGGATGAGQ